ncbi:Plasmodium exported protein, unknown function [Plasmodium malariae]|uniref:Fam-m protein n=1 Tax=Plasmodium malariae TaxID=5858 RepID=A0A1D3JIF5_PLAMA|nr:Plasmodium exported protein, unknown function [Plasmodium malariae]SBT86101.1 Plasmodium exported protein, unknown function [Plasmodium malariae]
MEKKIKLPFFIKIFSYIILSLIYHFYHDMSNFNKYLDGEYNTEVTLNKRTHRLLAKSKQKKGYITTGIVKNIPSINEYEKMCATNNAKAQKVKNKKTPQCPLNNTVGYEQTKKTKASVYNRGNSYFEKRVLDKIYYKNKVRYFTNSDLLFLKNDIKVNKSIISAATSFFLIIGVIGGISYIFNLENVEFNFTLDWNNGMIILCSIFVLIGIIVMICLYREIVKYGKLKQIKSKMHNTEYPSL